MNLRDEMIKYTSTTKLLINNVENEKYDSLNELLLKRQAIIDTLEKLDYSKAEFVKICAELNLLNLENQFYNAMKLKENKIKDNLLLLRKNKKAHRIYNSSFTNNNYFIKKKI